MLHSFICVVPLDKNKYEYISSGADIIKSSINDYFLLSCAVRLPLVPTGVALSEGSVILFGENTLEDKTTIPDRFIRSYKV